MTPRDTESKLRALHQGSTSTANRIRRYSLDSRLQSSSIARAPDKDLWVKLGEQLDVAWKEWLVLREELYALSKAPTDELCRGVEKRWLELDREVDLIQRELVSPGSTAWGTGTILALTVTLLLAIYAYLATHGMATLNVDHFEVWPDWGPVKYLEVASWAFFGVLCSMLYLASYYVARRDFDTNYVGWYLSTALRAPLLVVILMMVVLEFVEWYGEGTWIEHYILEEGNKFYFIVFMSFCLGIASESTASIINDLTQGVATVVRNIVRRVAERLGAVISDADILRR